MNQTDEFSFFRYGTSQVRIKLRQTRDAVSTTTDVADRLEKEHRELARAAAGLEGQLNARFAACAPRPLPTRSEHQERRQESVHFTTCTTVEAMAG